VKCCRSCASRKWWALERVIAPQKPSGGEHEHPEDYEQDADVVRQVDDQAVQNASTVPGRVRKHVMRGEQHEQRQEEPAKRPGGEVVEHPPGEPLGDARQRKDAVDLGQVATLGRPPARKAWHEVGDDVIAERCVQSVVEVAERVRRIELVAVLAVDESTSI
jgi:hypothetical protein